ncbi:MAG: 2-C-methyl-D-erythritol 4-phosphate cytidylyltransferase [Clostridium sp.]|jgi:2-C-methyl-D-erythritol 4-phosphate cytidylyltransferase|nr:2-C-methyl-D-erythritol 4-phosphate cytidylyltransferase [Clostridium sp.]
MVVAAIFAAGEGSRVGAATPKQFLPLGGKPMLLRCAESFISHPQVDYVVILCSAAWLTHTKNMFMPCSKLRVTVGGEDRIGTLEAALAFCGKLACGAEDILLTHDAARPFVSERIITENIDAARKYAVCGTYLPCADSLVRGREGFAAETIARDGVYRAQTPQSFRIGALTAGLSRLGSEEKSALTDACGLFTALGERVKIIQGESVNFKITTAEDLALAKLLAGGSGE